MLPLERPPSGCLFGAARPDRLPLFQANINAPCTLLDFPTLDRFIHQITTNHYDIVGIGAIITNVEKVQTMCQLVRDHLPEATIVVGEYLKAWSPEIHLALPDERVVVD